MTYKNAEGYPDHTAGTAIREADRPPDDVTACIRRMKPWQTGTGWKCAGGYGCGTKGRGENTGRR